MSHPKSSAPARLDIKDTLMTPAVFGLLIQRYLVRGLTFGAIKR